MSKNLCKQLLIEQCIAKRVFCICSHILNHQFFEGIAREDVHNISLAADVIRLAKDEYLFLKSSPVENVYFVLEGLVKIYSEDFNSSKQFISEIVEDGGSIGLEYLLDDKVHYPRQAKCLCDSVILKINQKQLKKVVSNNEELQVNLIKFLSQELNQSKQRSEALALNEVSERLKGYLKTNNLKDIEQIKISKTDLAHLLGTIPATLSRSIVKLKN